MPGGKPRSLAHDLADGAAMLTLLEGAGAAIAVGGRFHGARGCDKRIETCAAKFANVANFRGFPHIPGQDAVLRYATTDGGITRATRCAMTRSVPVSSADPADVSVARSWLGTPYHDQASLKGVGCDCLGLARGVWREVVGSEPFPIPPYSRDWGETGPHEVLAEGARRMMREIAAAEPRPARWSCSG